MPIFEPLEPIAERMVRAIETREDSVAGTAFTAVTVNVRIDDLKRVLHAVRWEDNQ